MSTAEFSLFLVNKGMIDRSNSRFKEIMGWTDEDLFRRPLGYLVPPDAHERIDRLMETDEEILGRVTFPHIPLRLKSGGFINFDMKIEIRENDERRLDFYKPGRADPEGGAEAAATDMYTFFNFVEALLNTPFDDDIEVTMVNIEALKADAEAGLSAEQRAAAGKDIEARLAGMAVGGQVGKLDEASYGLITAGDFDEKAFQDELKQVARRLNIAEDALESRAANVSIDDRDIEPEKLHQALNQARGVFVGELEGDADKLESLSNVLDGIEHHRKLVLGALEEHKFLASPRLVSDNIKSVSIAVLQQGKINLERRIIRPDDLIVMADHPDVSLKHDLAQLDRLVRMRVGKSTFERERPDYYEVCRSTMIQKDFIAGVSGIMKKHGEEPARVGFRVKGLPPVKVGGPHWTALEALAKAGHPLWLDRFGDAVVDPDAFGSLKGGFVEMPVDMMRKLAEHFDGEELMKKLIQTWDKMDVRVIAADLPTYDLKSLAQKLGITISLEDPVDADEDE